MSDSNNKILIIDDEKMNIIALAHFLKPQFEIIIAADGQSGIEAAEKHKPDLILLDIIMPDMDGFEVLEKLKLSEITKKIPVIFISGLNTSQDEEKGMSSGAVDYITKPFNKFVVKKRIETQFKLMEYERIIEKLSKLLDNKNSV